MINKGFTTAPYDKNDFPRIVELWSEQYDHHEINARKELFKWISADNPFMDGESPYLLLLDGGRVIGMHGRMPLWFTIFGKKQRGYFAHDVLLSKNYRGKGLGKIILDETFKKTDEFAGALWFNEPNYRLYSKCNWLDVPNLYSYLLIHNPNYFLENKIRNAYLRKIVSTLLSKIIRLQRIVNPKIMQNINIEEVDEFKESIDSFLHKIAPKYGIMVARNSRYLNWKFVRKPFNDYRRFIAYENSGELCGYMVVRTERLQKHARGRILDFLVNPENPNIFLALINHCCNELHRKNVDYIQITTSSREISEVLRTAGFIRARKPFRFMVKNWEQYFDKNFVENIHNWYITDSDGDGDAWSL